MTKMPASLNPLKATLEQFTSSRGAQEGQYQIHQPIPDSNLFVDAIIQCRKSADDLVVLLPSAQPAAGDQMNPVFHRWSWASHLENAHVVTLSDPALYMSQSLKAAWFMSTEVDIVAHLAQTVEALAVSFGISASKITAYGSSMGGFGALMLASEIPGSRAVAEVPQLDMRKYSVRGAIDSIQQHALHGKSVEALFDAFPERVSVTERFIKNGAFPTFHLITNGADDGFAEQTELFSWCAAHRGDVDRVGDQRLLVDHDAMGHKPLPTAKAVDFLRSAMTSSNRYMAIKKPEEQLSYREYIDRATKTIEKIKFIRDEGDSQLYNSALSDLSRAAEVDLAADWPLRRSCSLIKLWTNSFNGDILDAANRAFDRKETLEAFIYSCRGYLYNFPLPKAVAAINALMQRTQNSDTRSVGWIFQALGEYEADNFDGYVDLIRKFQLEKSADFNPYIAIPVSTVVTTRPEIGYSSKTSLLGQELMVSDVGLEDYKYIVSASCDDVYFEKYGEYLIKSFAHSCKDALLHISVLTENLKKAQRLLFEWGDPSHVRLSEFNIEADSNKGPISSLIRFSYVTPLLDRGVPVVVLDLDTVLKRDLNELIEAHRGADVCSRVLGGGVAPWEKYTGGFAIFYPSEAGRAVAGYISAAANEIATTHSAQWWIDQNCFEAGIRFSRSAGLDVSLHNVIAERDRYCVMPVGNGESKLYSLASALNDVFAGSGA